MRRPFALAALGLALFSVAAGVLAPSEPFEPHNLFVVDESTIVYEYDGSGAQVPNLITGLSKLTGLDRGRGVAFGPDGGLYVSDLDLDQILVYASSGGAPAATLQTGGLADPTDLAFGRSGNLFVGSEASDSIFEFNCDGDFVREFGGDDGLVDPRGLAVARDGDLFVSSFGSDEVLEFAREGQLLSANSDDLDGPWGLAFGRDGRLYVANNGADDISVFSLGPTSLELDERIGGDAGLDGPTDLAFGPDGSLYVANGNGTDVSVLSTAGTLLGTVGGSSGLAGPTGLAFSPEVMGASIKGTVADATGRRKLRSRARLSWAPGSGELSLWLTESDDELATLFGQRVMVFGGFTTDGEKRQSFVGQTGGGRLDEGLGVIGLEFKGRTEDAGFDPSSFNGYLQRSSPDGAVDAKLKRTRKLP